MTRRSIIAAAIAGLLAMMPTATATATGAGAGAGASVALPPFTQPVVDEAGVLGSAVERQVNADLTAYQTRSGNQIAVAVVKTTGGRSIEDYAIDLARSWGVGQKDKDTGVLLLIVHRDRKLRIEVGRGLEGELTDLQSDRIIRERLVPLLAKGDAEAAVIQGTQAIRLALGDSKAGTLPPAPGSDDRGDGLLRRAVSLMFALGLAMLALVGRRRRGGGGGDDDQAGGRSAGEALWWGAALGGIGGFGGHGGGGGDGGGGFGGAGGDFGGGGAGGDW